MAARPANPGLRGEILAAATAIVEELGVEGLTMRDVAQRVGYSPTSIYLHFKSKDELLDNVVSEVFERFEAHLEAAETEARPEGRFRQRMRAYVEWAIRNPTLYRLMFETMFDAEYVKDTDPEVRARRARGLRHMHDLLVEAADPAGGPGVGGDAETRTLVAWAAAHGIASLSVNWRLFGIPDVMLPRDEVIDRALELTDALVTLVQRPADDV